MNEEKCYLCQAFDAMTYIMIEGADPKEAFHTVVEDLLIDTRQESFEEGYITALAQVNNMTSKAINELIECNCEECECNGSCN